jgi:Flp pilus assembly protein TadD
MRSLKMTRVMSVLALALALGGCVTTGSDTGSGNLSGPGLDERERSMTRVAMAASDSGDHATAINVYRKQSAAHPNRIEPVLALGEALLAVGSADEALPAFQRAIVLDPKSLEGNLGIGRACLALRRLDEASAAFDAVLARNPHNVRALNGKGVAADLSGRHEEAQNLYLTGLEVAPDDRSLWNNLGLSLTFSRQYRDAVDILTRIATAPGATSRMRQNLALALGLSGKDDAAAQVSRVDLNETAVASNLRFYAAAQQFHKPGLIHSRPIADAAFASR